MWMYERESETRRETQSKSKSEQEQEREHARASHGKFVKVSLKLQIFSAIEKNLEMYTENKNKSWLVLLNLLV